MKFTRRALMRAMEKEIGLKVGDKIKLPDGSIYEVIEYLNGNPFLAKRDTNIPRVEFLTFLVDKEIEILPRPKRVGDLKCDGNCICCPIRTVCGRVLGKSYKDCTLYERLEKYTDTSKFYLDREIYDLLKARLDEEVDA